MKGAQALPNDRLKVNHRNAARRKKEMLSMETGSNETWALLKSKTHIAHKDTCTEGMVCRDVCKEGWIGEGEEERNCFSLQVRVERGMGYGCGLGQAKDVKSYRDTRQKTKAHFSLALMAVFIPSLLA